MLQDSDKHAGPDKHAGASSGHLGRLVPSLRSPHRRPTSAPFCTWTCAAILPAILVAAWCLTVALAHLQCVPGTVNTYDFGALLDKSVVSKRLDGASFRALVSVLDVVHARDGCLRAMDVQVLLGESSSGSTSDAGATTGLGDPTGTGTSGHTHRLPLVAFVHLASGSLCQCACVAVPVCVSTSPRVHASANVAFALQCSKVVA